VASATEKCPRTLALLRQIPSVKAAMFASLPPGATLVRHRDPYAGSLRFHLGLVTPNDPACFIEVDGQRYHWRDGEAVMFDETFIHHAANTTDHQRVVLFCDIERPLWTAPMRWFNRFFAKHVMAAAASQNVEGEAIGGLNTFFYYGYQLRIQAKKLKSSHRLVYYAGKWAMILGLLWLIFW
jgi:beta-hydroxylase